MAVQMNRRDFLKLLALLPPSVYFPGFVGAPEHPLQDPLAKNILIVVFDAFSAQHIPFYGYPRQTMPNLSRIAEQAIVYHNHHSAGNWTTPGTASLLTGVYPWTHRAMSERDDITRQGVEHNIFTVFDQYYRIGYSHNTIVNRFLHQFHRDLELMVAQKDLFIADNFAFDKLFPWDSDISPLSWDRIMLEGEKGYTYSLVLAGLYQKYHAHAVSGILKDFPRGIPHTGEDSYFTLEDAIDWLQVQLIKVPNPFIGYFHFLPPHRPYNTRRDFFNTFNKDDGIGVYKEKPRHPIFGLSAPVGRSLAKYEEAQRRYYDEFILYLDSEFGRLYDFMQQNRLLENTWVIFTSDHGEMFERGIIGQHKTPLLYEPDIHIPLLIMEPGRQSRRDIYSPTSAVDVLPTIAKVAGLPLPDWTEGTVMPPFSDTFVSSDRPIFTLEATNSKEGEPLSPASVMMIKGKYKLTRYWGYEQLKGIGDLYELYDLENDPDEMHDIYSADSVHSREMRELLLTKVEEVDKPYAKG